MNPKSETIGFPSRSLGPSARQEFVIDSMHEALSLQTFGALVGGLGLFLLAVSMITDGLRLAAGNTLRDVLARWTKTPLLGIATGAMITAIVQSSSAVTVATIGFVNANLMTMQRALGVVYGANIGTTMTAWLVAAIGFKLDVELFALPMIGIGMLLRLTGVATRRASIGEALVGFGLFFVGIDVLRGAFEGLAQSIDLASLGASSSFRLLIFVGIGAFMTLVTQSSSAAIAIILTAASGGVIDLNGAASLVIGANVGTTSTAVFAAMGATPNAKRVASAHVIFNLVTGVVAFLVLPLMFGVVDFAVRALDLEMQPAVVLAMFHSLFNMLGVVLMLPFTAKLAAFLQARFVTTAENLGRPRFLDATTLHTPVLALDAMRLELQRILELVRRMAITALQPEPDRQSLLQLQLATTSLVENVDDNVTRIERGRTTESVAAALAAVLRITQEVGEATHAALALAKGSMVCPQTAAFKETADQLLAQWRPETVVYDEVIGNQFREIDALYTPARKAILVAAAGGQMRAATAHDYLNQLRAAHHMLQKLGKSARQLQVRVPQALDIDGEVVGDADLPDEPATSDSPAEGLRPEQATVPIG